MGIREAFGLREREDKHPAKAVVASAVPLSGPGVRAVNRSRKQVTQQDWQREAWYYFDVIGEARGPIVWIANAVSQADLHASDIDPDTGKPTGPSGDQQAQTVANGALGGVSQRAQLLRLVALCWQVPGEAWLIVRPSGKRNKPDQWLVLSGDKMHAKGESWQYTDPFTAELITLKAGTDRLIRIWCPHPDDQSKADSAMRPALPICREVEKASQNIAARLDSRLALNGIGLVADELSIPQGEFETSGAAVMDLLLQAAEANLQNPGQASAQVPILLNAPAEFIANGGAFTHIDLATEFDGQVVELRVAGLDRLASTLDMPKSVAQGTTDEANHWSAWQVEESTYKIFIEPLLKAIGDAITEHWFRPALIAMGWTPERAELVELGWDTTAIVARPDDTENLRDLHDRLLISDEYMLAENGVPEDARPTDEERTRRFLEEAVKVAPTLLADPNVAKAIGLDIEVSPVAAGVDAEVGSGGELEAPEPEPANVRALPTTQGQENDPEAVPEGLVAAAEVLVMQALDRAGGRLLTNQNRGQFKDTPRHELYRVIRPEMPHALVDVRFADGVAEAFGLSRYKLTGHLSSYLEYLLSTGAVHNRARLVEHLRDAR